MSPNTSSARQPNSSVAAGFQTSTVALASVQHSRGGSLDERFEALGRHCEFGLGFFRCEMSRTMPTRPDSPLAVRCPPRRLHRGPAHRMRSGSGPPPSRRPLARFRSALAQSRSVRRRDGPRRYRPAWRTGRRRDKLVVFVEDVDGFADALENRLVLRQPLLASLRSVMSRRTTSRPTSPSNRSANGVTSSSTNRCWPSTESASSDLSACTSSTARLSQVG